MGLGRFDSDVKAENAYILEFTSGKWLEAIYMTYLDFTTTTKSKPRRFLILRPVAIVTTSPLMPSIVCY